MGDDPLDSLDTRLAEARREFNAEHAPAPATQAQSMNDGARAGIELVGGLIGGGILGFALDKLFDTSPFLFILFLFLGVMTGFYNIYKITQNMGTSVGFKPLPNAEKNAKQGTKINDDDDDD